MGVRIGRDSCYVGGAPLEFRSSEAAAAAATAAIATLSARSAVG